MGGGHVSRPDFGMPQPDPAHPLTEFYCLLQRALDREGVFALPALYAQFRAPARRIYADEAADFLTLSPDEEVGSARLLAPAQLQLLYSSLHVMPDGAPAALLLTEECTRTVYAVIFFISGFPPNNISSSVVRARVYMRAVILYYILIKNNSQ